MGNQTEYRFSYAPLEEEDWINYLSNGVTDRCTDPTITPVASLTLLSGRSPDSTAISPGETTSMRGSVRRSRAYGIPEPQKMAGGSSAKADGRRSAAPAPTAFTEDARGSEMEEIWSATKRNVKKVFYSIGLI